MMMGPEEEEHEEEARRRGEELESSYFRDPFFASLPGLALPFLSIDASEECVSVESWSRVYVGHVVLPYRTVVVTCVLDRARNSGAHLGDSGEQVELIGEELYRSVVIQCVAS